MPQGYEVEDGKGGRAWWDGKKLTPMNESGFTVAGPGRTTEGERTAGFLASRAADSAKNLSTIGQRNPNANKPNLFEAAATAANAPGIANALRGGDRQQVYANQLDLLDAALTLGTGAAYTREQLNNYRDTYFPGLTDKPETVKAKRQKLLSLLEAAKIKAGGAAPPSLDEAIGQMRGPQGASMENPYALTEKNRRTSRLATARSTASRRAQGSRAKVAVARPARLRCPTTKSSACWGSRWLTALKSWPKPTAVGCCRPRKRQPMRRHSAAG
jgi:hypothetical protein